MKIFNVVFVDVHGTEVEYSTKHLDNLFVYLFRIFTDDTNLLSCVTIKILSGAK